MSQADPFLYAHWLLANFGITAAGVGFINVCFNLAYQDPRLNRFRSELRRTALEGLVISAVCLIFSYLASRAA